MIGYPVDQPMDLTYATDWLIEKSYCIDKSFDCHHTNRISTKGKLPDTDRTYEKVNSCWVVQCTQILLLSIIIHIRPLIYYRLVYRLTYVVICQIAKK